MKNIEINRVFSTIGTMLYGVGTISDLAKLLPPSKCENVIVIRDTKVRWQLTGIDPALELSYDCSALGEPTSKYVNQLFDSIKQECPKPSAIIAVGGGSVMDIGKAISVLYTNQDLDLPSAVEALQGWDLVKEPGVFKIGVPTIFGSGSEASRTAVLKKADRKLGINSEFSQFDGVLIDPGLAATVNRENAFFSAMDCYIHCVESLTGCYKNHLAQIYAETALNLCKNFLSSPETSEDLAVASYFGGVSIVNSEVGVCHALSYGLSKLFDINHGEANCIIFQHLDKVYGDYCKEFRAFANEWNIKFQVVPSLSDAEIEEMIAIALKMERPLENAFGENYLDQDLNRQFREVYRSL